MFLAFLRKKGRGTFCYEKRILFCLLLIFVGQKKKEEKERQRGEDGEDHGVDGTEMYSRGFGSGYIGERIGSKQFWVFPTAQR